MSDPAHMPLPALALALLLAALMGFAVQRGATCMVAAVEEWVSKGTARRSLAIGEASLWVLGGLALLQLAGLARFMPQGFAVTGWTLLGGLLLGLGAAVNRACVFGAVARFGNGEWAYALTPAGYLVGALLGASTLPTWLPQAQPLALPGAAWVLQPDATAGLMASAVVVGGWMLWRLTQPLLGAASTDANGRLTRWRATIWQPHQATLVIGLSFVLLLGLAGRWTYIELLSDAAHGHWQGAGRRLLLFVALGAGAAWGGWTARRFAPKPWRTGAVLRCLLGGALMGLGAELVPGANDGLILLGLPLLWPHAWVAVAAMTLIIAAWFGVQRVKRPAPGS